MGLLNGLLNWIASLLESLIATNPDLAKELIGLMLWIQSKFPWLANLIEGLMRLLS